MDVVTVAALSGLAGAGASLGIGAAVFRRRQEMEATIPDDLPPGVGDVLAVLRSSGIVLNASDRVLTSSPAAVASGLVRGHSLVQPQLLALARQVRRDGVIRELELELPRGPHNRARMVAHARVAPLGVRTTTDTPDGRRSSGGHGGHVLLLVEDRTRARRVEEVRRDFVANVSHELKTPVGGIALLAEAVIDAHDDPEAVTRFAKRISVESERLSRLVREIVDFSRLQVADVISDPVEVDIPEVVAVAVDRVRVLAEDRRAEIAVGDPVGTTRVWGDPDLLATAVGNLLANAVAYSEPGSRVGVTTRENDGTVSIAVTDQGVGIAPADQERIFERFYRVDAARSRATGGTGLGLAIVKHIAQNHGGEVSVWSEVGHGSTFTISLPASSHRSPDSPSTPAKARTKESP